jgi:hypothetical protein
MIRRRPGPLGHQHAAVWQERKGPRPLETGFHDGLELERLFLALHNGAGGGCVEFCMCPLNCCALFVNIDDEGANLSLVHAPSHRGHTLLWVAIANATRNAGVVASIPPGAVGQAGGRAAGHVYSVTAGALVCVELSDFPAATGRISLCETRAREENTQATHDDPNP